MNEYYIAVKRLSKEERLNLVKDLETVLEKMGDLKRDPIFNMISAQAKAEIKRKIKILKKIK